MTRLQSKAVDAIRDRLFSGHEWKWFEIRDEGRYLLVICEHGIPNDHNDARSVFCRIHGMFRVGARGGIKAVLAPKRTPKTLVAKNPLIYGFRGFGE